MNHIVLDVSSDEEDDEFVNSSDTCDGILKVSDEKPKSADLLVENEDNDGDDCEILDYDPSVKEIAVETCETDEVVVTGQKHEIACRDFPHPRHACAKFPFKSTSHQQHCENCYCYVCDTRAPCPYWFNGFSTDHCHANDKEQTWQNQRKRIKAGNIVSKLAPNVAQCKRVSSPRAVPLPQNSSTPATQLGIKPCSRAATLTRHIRAGYRTEQSSPRAVPLPQNSSTPAIQLGINPCSRAAMLTRHTRAGYGIEQSSPRAVPLPQNSSTAATQLGIKPCFRAATLTRHTIPGYRTEQSSPQAVTSNQYLSTQRPSRGISCMGNDVQSIAQRSQATHYAAPVPSLSNAQQIVTGGFSSVPVATQFNRNMNYGNLQTHAVPSMTPNQQEQQPGRSKDKVLSELEDWLLDDSTFGRPLPSFQDNATF